MTRFPLLLPSILALLLALPSVSAAEDEQQPEELLPLPQTIQPVSEVGRYGLFDGQLVVVSLKGPDVVERHLMKIDTVTGQTWIGKQVQYVDRKGKVVQHRYWEPFEQYIEGAAPPAAQGR